MENFHVDIRANYRVKLSFPNNSLYADVNVFSSFLKLFHTHA